METIISAMLVGTAAAIAISVWLRRETFGSPVESHKTIGITLTGIGVALISPQAVPYVGTAAHMLTGLWQIDAAIGHIAIILGQMLIVYGLLGYALDDDARRVWFDRWIQPLATPAAAAIIISIIASSATSQRADNILDLTDDAWMRVHWFVITGTLAYVWLAAVRVLLMVYVAVADPASRYIAGWYAAWFVVAITAAETAAVRTIVGHPVFSHGIVSWTLFCAGLSGICATTAYSWRAKVRAMCGNNCLCTPPPRFPRIEQ